MPFLVLATFACAPRPPAVGPSTPQLPAQAFISDLEPLERAVRERLERETGEYAVSVIDLETGRSFGVNDRLVVHAASTMKVPVLLELYRRSSAGEIRLDDTLPVRNRFRSIADTTHYSLDPKDDSDSTLYRRVGQPATLRELGRLMIVRSSNLATNLLIDTLRAARVQRTTDLVGGDGMRVLRGVEDNPAYRAGLNNTTTAQALSRVLAAIARCDILLPAECMEIIDVLAAQEFDDMIPAGLPPGTRVANKTGWITGIKHDAAIIMPDGSPPYVLTVLTRGAADTAIVRRVAADISRLAWSALGPGGSLRPQWPAATAVLLATYAQHRTPAFPAPVLGYEELWATLGRIVDAAPAVTREEIGRSGTGRPLYLVSTGTGPTRVLLWSQMHGDETTATRALTDLFGYIASAPDDARVRRWSEQLTILALPMLNPDGAAVHRRRNAAGIDVNRDARALATAEGRALKQVQERWTPQFGFNLHDQNPRSRVGSSSRVAAIALLAPAPDAAATRTPSFVRAQQLTAHIAAAVAPLVGDHLTRYDDSWNARAFGDGMQAWGVSTVLIETGSWGRDEFSHYLRGVNFVALASALDAIATGTYAAAGTELYTSLPENGRPMNDLLIHGGTLVLPGQEARRADITIDAAAVGGPAATQIVDVGDLAGVEARDTIDATALFIHAADADGIRPGVLPVLQLRRTAAATSELVWEVVGTRARRFTAR